jgi:hypothetical protein
MLVVLTSLMLAALLPMEVVVLPQHPQHNFLIFLQRGR